jgi:hypothetical protein
MHWAVLSATKAEPTFLSASCSDVRGTNGVRNVGSISVLVDGNDYSRAAAWTGTVERTRDLNVSGFESSWANGIQGDQVVGQASGTTTGGHAHAVLWHIGDRAVVDLNGTINLESAALATNGRQTTGWASDAYGESVHAMLWSGARHTPIDLNPESFDDSYAYAIDGSAQVGVGMTRGWAHALLWKGHAARVIDLNPAGFIESYATGVSGNRQVGYAVKSDLGAHALVWFGKASNYIDLQKFLPPSLTQSYAMSIDAAGEIGGYATQADGTPHAVVWQPIRTEKPPAGKVASTGP